MTTPGARKTILVVEDEPAVLEVLAATLSKAGYEVLAASAPQAALELCRARREPIDLLLTDVVMPQMNGADLAERVRALWPNIPVLCVAGMPDTPVVRSLIERGFAFLPKPFLPPELVQKVAEVLSGPGLVKAASSA